MCQTLKRIQSLRARSGSTTEQGKFGAQSGDLLRSSATSSGQRIVRFWLASKNSAIPSGIWFVCGGFSLALACQFLSSVGAGT